MSNANTINMTTQKPNGKLVTTAISYANPNTADSDTAQFVTALAGLSENTLVSIQKIAKTDLTIPQS